MTATEILREEVKHYIDNADEKALRMVKAILEIEQEIDTNNEEEDWEDLPEELQKLIDQGIKEAEEGKTISFEQFKEKHSRWFKK